MKISTRALVVASMLGSSAGAFADPFFGNNASTILSGVKDTSNLWSATTGYGFNVTTSSSEPAYFINQISLTPGANWDSHISFNTASSLGNGFPSNNYTLGTPLNGGQTYYWSDVVASYGAFDASIPSGIYDFTVSFLGGLDNSASDTLFTQALQVQVFDKWDVSFVPSTTPSTIAFGETATVSGTLTNNMTGLTAVTSAWFVSGAGGPGGAQLDLNFVGNWFNQSLAPGESRTDDHSAWTAGASATSQGLYRYTAGVLGGLYDGDQLFMSNGLGGFDENVFISVVPAPGAAALIGLGGLIATRRRR